MPSATEQKHIDKVYRAYVRKADAAVFERAAQRVDDGRIEFSCWAVALEDPNGQWHFGQMRTRYEDAFQFERGDGDGMTTYDTDTDARILSLCFAYEMALTGDL